jgi:hypothetical protein
MLAVGTNLKLPGLFQRQSARWTAFHPAGFFQRLFGAACQP